MFWCGLSGPRDPLSRLADSLAAAGRRAGVQMGEPKRFRPHLTLARARADVDVRELVAVLDAFAGTPWEVTEIHLVRSHLGAHVRYETLESWPLGRRAPGPGARRDRGGGRSRERGSGGSGERGSGGSTAEGG
ncbi:2'-5' RNA ligase family protein [Thermocatellispora tengchongensis]|uniref:2'-5' RNA ligase family protein n=1 Tax=Thermocatellispora tengchongensis TaxID=1073253 RepID=UPI00363FC9CB